MKVIFWKAYFLVKLQALNLEFPNSKIIFMQILVVNCGSSSVKAEAIDLGTGKRIVVMSVDRINDAQPKLKFSDSDQVLACPASGHEQALAFAFPKLIEKLDKICSKA
jgi:acetate kinase